MTDQFTEQSGYEVGFVNVPQNILFELRILGVDLTESLLAPSLQTSIMMQDTIHTNPVKILDWFKESTVQIDCYRKVNEMFSTVSTMSLAQTIFRLENRMAINPSTEVYTLQACDPSLLVNAARRVSKSWECVAPDQIVKDVLTKCIQAKNVETEEGGPPRTYFAENIKPFQVVAQQADTALAGGDDPSFLHYMTYENYGTHHFR